MRHTEEGTGGMKVTAIRSQVLLCDYPARRRSQKVQLPCNKFQSMDDKVPEDCNAQYGGRQNSKDMF